MHICRKTVSSVILSVSLLLSLSAQENRVNKILMEMHTSLYTGKHYEADYDVLYKPGNEMFVLTHVSPWVKDTVESVRTEVMGICAHIGLNTSEAAFRQEAVRLIVQTCRNRDGSFNGSALNYLTHFSRTDFTKDACDSIGAMVHEPSLQQEKLIRLVGFLDLRSQIPFLENLLNNSSTKLQWNVHLALARLGNESCTNAILGLVKNYPVNDNVMYHILPDLVYARQKPIFSYLLEILNSDKRDCTSPNPYYSGNILCGYRVMEELAKVVIDFPLKTTKSGEIVTNDYEKALQTSRKWFAEHSEYKLNMEIY